MKHESFIRYEVVLTAKSVKESDIESFIEDAELHLIEGESDGKKRRRNFRKLTERIRK